ncbi:hypothetical protein JCM5350_007118 [Sporobolomyces pararoseus]
MSDPLVPFTPVEIQNVQNIVSIELAPALALIQSSNSQVEPHPFRQLPLLLQQVQSISDRYRILLDYLPDELYSRTLHEIESINELLLDLEQRGPRPVAIVRPPFRRTLAGRQAYDIPRQELADMILEGFTNEDMAELLAVSRATIERCRARFQLGRVRTTMTDEEAEGAISQVLQDGHENMGEVGLRSVLSLAGINLPREQVRKIVRKLRPHACTERWLAAIQRRRYSVPFPNSLWHIDGHHKLVRYGFVTHGGIDGKTRLVVFLRCSDNNEASTVYASFKEAVEKHGWPSRVRADYGGENMEVKRDMEFVRGEGRGSFIQGRSVHNQRIERLWRDVFSWKIMTFKAAFEGFEAEGILNPTNSVHLWALHLVYLPLINRALDSFVLEWNYHKLRTEHKSPVALFRRGVLQARRAGFDIFASPFRGANTSTDDDIVAAEGISSFAMYGATYGRARETEPRDQHVRIPEIPRFLTDEQAQTIVHALGPRPLWNDMVWAKTAYLYVCHCCAVYLNV